MPIALLEAMAAGKPLLTAKAGAIPHIVSDPENGVVLDAVSTDAIEAGLRRLLNDQPIARRPGTQCRVCLGTFRSKAGRRRNRIALHQHCPTTMTSTPTANPLQHVKDAKTAAVIDVMNTISPCPTAWNHLVVGCGTGREAGVLAAPSPPIPTAPTSAENFLRS